MVKNNDKGFSLIIIVFIILITSTVMLAGYSFLIVHEMGFSGIEMNEQKALYIAEAGIERLMEYLEGDTDWSDNNGTGVINENFGDGSYSVDLSSGTRTTIVVTSEGTVGSGPRQVDRKVRQKIRRLPEAFNYAVFWEGGGTLIVQKGAVVINGGDVFTKDTISSDSPGTIDVTDGGTPSLTSGGFVYTTASWTAGGTYTEATKPNDEPSYPALDTTFYDNLITTAEAQVVGDLIQTGGSYSVSGTTYVNGVITFSGVTVTGSGTLVATGNITIQSSTTVTPNSGNFIRFISKTSITITGSSTTASGTLAYGRSSVGLDGVTVTGAFISAGTVTIDNDSAVTGYAYADTLEARNNATVNGSLVVNRFAGNRITNPNKTITINYDHSYLEDAAPGLGLDIDGDANEEGVIIKVPGTWQQL